MYVNDRTSPLDKIGLTAAFLTASGWGVAGIFIQFLPSISASSIVATRLTLALAIFTPILFFKKDNFFAHIVSLRRPITWSLSAILFACYTLGTMSFQMAPVGEATLLMTTAPIFVILFKFFAREQTHRNEYLGALLAIVGIGLVVLPRLTIDNVVTDQRVIGDVLALLVSILFATYAIWFSSLNNNNNAPNSMSVTLGTFTLGCIMALLVAPHAFSEYNNLFNRKIIISFIGLGILSTAIPTLTYTVAAKRLPPLLTTGILLLEPVLAIVFAFLILKEIPSLWIAPGILFILVGLILIGRCK